MRALRPLLSGREARRAAQFGPGRRLKGAGWTRSFRKGRKQRQLVTHDIEQDNLATPEAEESE